MMRKYIIYILIYILIIGLLTYLLSQESLAIETDTCKNCHGISKQSITKDCSTCHGMHSSPLEPKTRDPIEVHDIHKDAGKTVRQSDCLTCHKSPVDCAQCHDAHGLGLESIRKINATNLANATVIGKNLLCTDCHGPLPRPKGHENFRDALLQSKHRWMTCDSCHLNPSIENDYDDYEFKLRFKDIFVVSMNDSSQICKICHSSQYEGMTEGTHGTLNETCVNCHNPHTTKFTGPKFLLTPTETPPTNISTQISEGKKWLFEKVPILRNTTLMAIIFILIFVFTSEYVLSIHEKGKKVAYNMVKFTAEEETLKTLEIKLKDKNVGLINQKLEKYGDILGMTMKKEDNIYKYIIFVNTNVPIDEIGEKNLIDEITSLSEVESAKFTDKYEL